MIHTAVVLITVAAVSLLIFRSHRVCAVRSHIQHCYLNQMHADLKRCQREDCNTCAGFVEGEFALQEDGLVNFARLAQLLTIDMPCMVIVRNECWLLGVIMPPGFVGFAREELSFSAGDPVVQRLEQRIMSQLCCIFGNVSERRTLVRWYEASGTQGRCTRLRVNITEKIKAQDPAVNGQLLRSKLEIFILQRRE